MTKRRRTLFFVTGGLVLAGVTVAYLVWNQPHRDVSKAHGVAVGAPELYRQLALADSLHHPSSLVHQVVLVTGEVSRVQNNQKGERLVLLKTGTPGAFVNCTLEGTTPTDIRPGSTVSLKGICSGYMGGDPTLQLPGDVYLIRCYPEPPKK